MPKPTNIIRVDQLMISSIALPLTPENSQNEAPAVGIIQELLIGHGFTSVPGFRHRSYGRFDAKTIKAVKTFRIKHLLQQPDDPVQIDHWTLLKLVQEKATSPRATRAYLALALDIDLTRLAGILSFITMAEGAGKFAAFNANTDKQGLSYGIIQWAQKPTRLSEIVSALQTSQPQLFNAVFGRDANGMVLHTKKANGGVNKTTGITLDTKYDLITDLWKERFLQAALDVTFQKSQVALALTTFRKDLGTLRTYATVISSERGFGYMLDLVNQHGPTGGRDVYATAVKPTMTEDEALASMTIESVRRLRKRYGDDSPEAKGTEDRRNFFQNTHLLSTNIFNEDEIWTPPGPILP